jgi:ribosomal protein S9
MGLKDMRGFSIIAFVAVLSTPCLAQNGPDDGQCEQVRAAISQYGLQAARKHATENYGLTQADLRRVEQDCGIDNHNRRSKKKSSS